MKGKKEGWEAERKKGRERKGSGGDRAWRRVSHWQSALLIGDLENA